jgi:hypothetical protein
MTISKARLLALCAFGLCADPAGAQLSTDMKLTQAGFAMRTARDAQDLAHVKKLPPRVFVSRKTAAGTYYLYADPDNCRCVFVGSVAAMQAYRDMSLTVPQPDNVVPRGMAVQDQLIRDMDADLSDQIDDGNILHFGF